nr:RHS repeat-associated core domain-containing protein [Pseudomonas sp. UFMG81]
MQMSVLNHFHQSRETFAYSPYGTRSTAALIRAVLGFNGQPRERTGSYILGAGYRSYNPVLMRFNSPDSLSPFGRGGFNAYGYCEGDPVNYTDPSGHGRNERSITPVTHEQWQTLDPTTLKAMATYRQELNRLREKTAAVENNRDSLAATPEVKERHPNAKAKHTSDDVPLKMVEMRLNFRRKRESDHKAKRTKLLAEHRLTDATAAIYDLAAEHEKTLRDKFGPPGSQSQDKRLNSVLQLTPVTQDADAVRNNTLD